MVFSGNEALRLQIDAVQALKVPTGRPRTARLPQPGHIQLTVNRLKIWLEHAQIAEGRIFQSVDWSR